MVLFFKKGLLALPSLTVETETSLQALAPDWHALWQRTPAATPFQSPAWQLAWWRQFGTPRPVLATLRAEGRLLGLLPCYVLPEEGKLLPIGAGISDTLDVLLAPEAPPDAAGRLLAEALRAAGPIARADFIELPPASPLRTVPAPAGWRSTRAQGEPCPVLRLTGARLRESISKAAHRTLRMNRNRAGRAGGALLRLATAETLEASVETLFALHASRWTQQGEPDGVLADARVGACLREAAPGLHAAGALSVAELCIGPNVAAACMVMYAGADRILLYLSGFDAAYAACSPGSLLVDALARKCLDEDRREIHFLRGGEAYKYGWGAVDRHNATHSFLPA